ncbi:MAG TPA: hypothetical protein ENN17_04865 [bacterium]|nr:hypothetical protein [bacterium]
MKMNNGLKWILWGSVLFLMAGDRSLQAQVLGGSGELRWLRVNALHAYFSEQGSESETAGTEERTVSFSWPGEYGIVQATLRSKGMWLGCKNFYHSLADKTVQNYVINVGLKPNEYTNRPISDAYEFKLLGRQNHPIVMVAGEAASNLTYYDVLDEVPDPDLPADRVIVVRNHSEMGATITKKIYAYGDEEQGNYYIYDYVIKNTGIIDNEGTTNPQTLEDFYFSLLYRYTFAGESQWDDGSYMWGVSNSAWGMNVVTDNVGQDPTMPEFNDPGSLYYKLRAHWAYYGPHSERPVPLEDDWGCPNEQENGIMAAAKFAGHMTLHADKSPHDPTDDIYQPRTTQWIYSDGPEAKRAQSDFDEPLMNLRYAKMTAGHPARTHAEEVEASGQAANDWGEMDHGVSSVQCYGPYTLEVGDSIHIVVAGGVAGLSREKNKEVGWNWFQHYRGTSSPGLIMPDGSVAPNHTQYKKAWVWTSRDSLLQMFQNARRNYESGYRLSYPPPPEEFTITPGGDRIILSWADNATSTAGFDGYVICRSEGTVMTPNTVYKKVFECDASNTVHTWEDTSASRGFDYYYYIQTRNDGSDNDGRAQYSSKFWTMTSRSVQLSRRAESFLSEVRVVPNPYDIRSRTFQFGDKYQYDRIAFYGLPPLCKLRVYTERGDLIWEKDHTSTSGDELWDSLTSSRQIIVSGIYILYVEVTQDIYAEEDTYAWHDMYNENLQLRYQTGDLLYRKGEKIYSKGENIFRKFVVIR